MTLSALKTKIDETVVAAVARLDRLYEGRFLKRQSWPVAAGQYYVGQHDSSVALCTLGSIDLMRRLGPRDEIAILGKTFTENLGIEKMVRNIVSNPSIRVLIICGKESPHRVGQSLGALRQNGVDAGHRIIGSEGKLPVLKNVGQAEIERFRQQIEIIDLIGERQVDPVMRAVQTASAKRREPFDAPSPSTASATPSTLEHITCWHRESHDYKADPAGFFVIHADADSGAILAEHYSTGFELQRVLRGRTALEIYSTVIREGWVSDPGHTAYLGRELGKAELALQRDLIYEQNKELMDR